MENVSERRRKGLAMKFTKMHGLGNDYVYINCLQESVSDPAALSRKLSDRHFGVGGDGVILICPSEKADFTMDMYNADGSRGAMCGNGIRCVGKYVYDHGMTDKTSLKIETLSGIHDLELTVEDGAVSRVQVDMGEPVFEPGKIPVQLPDQDGGMQQVVAYPIQVLGKMYRMTCVSMGNPHAVVPVEDPLLMNIEKIGPIFEHLSVFPDRVNTEFIKVQDRRNVLMRVWERGSGETLACGTGACAVAAACFLNGWTDREVTVHLRGGDLFIRWDEETNRIYMTGPAVTVFEGEVTL